MIQLSGICECKSILFATIFSYCYAGSPSVTTLTFNSSSNTLTCTSTGGPATTVTWRRDGAVITLSTTHQQTKRVVDAVEGTYQTVLTIDPSVSSSDIVGTYNCTVSNTRGESSKTVVTGENYAFLHVQSIVTNSLCYSYIFSLGIYTMVSGIQCISPKESYTTHNLYTVQGQHSHVDLDM